MMKPCIGLLMLLGASPAFAQTAPWDTKFYNAHPAADDLALPLPCGGQLVFRPVDVPTENGPLDDRPVPMGDPDRALGAIEYIHNENLAAPFPATGSGRRYWIGKYVVSRDQFAAMHGTCAQPSFSGRVARTDVSQIEAMEAASAWSAWLLANAPDKLPKRGRELAYARLPTEVEWEFAARGGTKVSAEEFRGRTWPMPQGIEHYAVSGAVTDGRPQQIGVEALPNPLGLYGMLGSVDQMMLEPFRLNRVGRLQGDAGGVILRGGNYKDDLADLHTAMRSEMRPFDADKRPPQPMRMSTVGFRLVLSAPSAGDIPEAEAERQAFASLSAQHADALASNDPRKLVEAMRKEATDPADIRALDQLGASLTSAERAQADQDRDALRAEIEAAAVMANFVWRLEQNVKVTEAIITYIVARYDQLTQPGQVVQRPATVQTFETNQRKSIAAIRQEQLASLDGYLRFLRQIATGPMQQDLEREAAVVRQEMDSRGQQQLKGFLALVMRHAAALSSDRLPRPDRVLAEIVAVPLLSSRQ